MNLSKLIDHTLLRPDVSSKMIENLCMEALECHFKSVCVNPCWVKQAFSHLCGSDVLVCTVIGFPLGSTYSSCKIAECRKALDEGASEFDMVINIGALKSFHNDYVCKEIEDVVAAAQGKTVKVILETSLLNEEEKKLACRLGKQAGAQFVKTSTGFSSGGATLEDVRLMRLEVGSEMGVKASGGIRDLKTALSMLSQGATRLGTSSGVTIVKEMATPSHGNERSASQS